MMRRLMISVVAGLAIGATAAWAQESSPSPAAEQELPAGQVESMDAPPVAKPKRASVRENGASRPPQPLHLVGDHWTPYNPPTEFPPEAKIHIIQRGDTLWDLAKKFFNDPYLWPQLWEKNTYITDAHWIYPGDPLFVEGQAVSTSEVAETRTTTESSTTETVKNQIETLEATSVMPGIPVALGTEDDIYCFGYLDRENEVLPFKIVGSEEQDFRIRLTQRDIVYVDGGLAQSVHAGQEFYIVQDQGVVPDPVTGNEDDDLGRYKAYVGRLRIICAQENSSTAEITLACDGIPVGSWLKPFEPQPIPLAQRTPLPLFCQSPIEKLGATLVLAKDHQVSLGQDSMVFIDKGSEDRLVPGDFLVVWRPGHEEGFPRIIVGEVAVLTVQPHAATAKILESRFTIFPGDQLDLK